jgi:serine/threonine protein kinase
VGEDFRKGRLDLIETNNRLHMAKEIIEFLRKKDYLFLSDIGQGGTGKTILIKDEIIDEDFVCKKYSPYYNEHKSEYYKYFLDEIKILYNLYHKNIVRVFNYYLYPEQMTGYILMEYIKGDKIHDFLKNNPEMLNDTFVQVIEGFKHLEENAILHRDIRPDNILVSESKVAKIIDFGFGKRIEFEDDYDKSVSLNWRYAAPSEFSNKLYDIRTEVYFVGKLFQEIITEEKLENFKYASVLSEMIKVDYSARINSFFDVSRELLLNRSQDIEFSSQEATVYRQFAYFLTDQLSDVDSNIQYIADIDSISSALDDVYRNSMLEDYIQNPVALLRSFIKGAYRYKNKRDFPVRHLKAFIHLLKGVSEDKKKIIINNLWQRLDSVKRRSNADDDLPF